MIPNQYKPAITATLQDLLAGPFGGNRVAMGDFLLRAAARFVGQDLASVTLQTLLAELQGQSAPTPVTGNPVTPSTIRFDRQQLLAGVTYHWSTRDADADVARLRAAGYTGVWLELMELVVTGDLAAVQLQQVAKLKPWGDACRKYGMILGVSAWNTNDVLAPHGTNETVKARFDALHALGYNDVLMVQPMSENDNNTASGVQGFGRQYAATLWPAAQRCDYEGYSPDGAFTERHSEAHAASAGGGWRNLFVTDNGTQKFMQLSASDYVAMATRQIQRGGSFAVYCALDKTDLDWDAIGKIGSAFTAHAGGSQPAPSPVTPYASAVGYYKGSALATLGAMPVTNCVRSGKIDSRNITVDYDGQPFGSQAHFVMAWQEGGAWYWCPFEWCLNGAKVHNWSDNMLPGPGKSGICTEHNGTAHYPRPGARIYGGLCDENRAKVTNLVDCGTI